MKEIQTTGTWLKLAGDLNGNFREIWAQLERLAQETGGGLDWGTALVEQLKSFVRGASPESNALTDPQLSLGDFTTGEELNASLNATAASKYCGRLRCSLNGQNIDVFQFAINHDAGRYTQLALGNVVPANIQGVSSRLAVSATGGVQLLRRSSEQGEDGTAVWGEWTYLWQAIPEATADSPGLLSAAAADRLAAMERIGSKKINGNALFKLTASATASDVRAALSYGGSEPVTAADLDLCHLHALALRDVTSGAPVTVEWTGSAYVLLSLSRYHQLMQAKLRSVALAAAADGTLTVTVAGRTDSVVNPGTATTAAAGLMSKEDKAVSVRLSRQVLELGDFATSGEAEQAAMQPAVSGDNSVSLIRYTVSSSRKSGLILQQVGGSKTIQLLLWEGLPKMRHLYFTSNDRTAIHTGYDTKFFWCWPTKLHYDAGARSLDLGFFSDKFRGAVTLPLATSSQPGLMSRADKENLDALVAAPSIPASVLQAAPVAAVVGEVTVETVSIPLSQLAQASVVYSTGRGGFLWRLRDGFPQVGQEQAYKYYSAPSVGEPYETQGDDGTWTIREGLLVRSMADDSLLLFFGAVPRRILTENLAS